ncbi:MAG: hypothetical protein FD180_1571 [Planctomycetota bacterium]|nr:MAG: hypothetical protein FD180_1571 [Planctomycetota bacterium]
MIVRVSPRFCALLLLLAGCASDPSTPPSPAPDRVADFTPLRLGQPYLGGALEVTRFSQERIAGSLHLRTAVTNRTGSLLRLRWRFRYVDLDGWERRTRDSAMWREAALGAGEEWRWEGEAEVGDAAAAGMDWRYER